MPENETKSNLLTFEAAWAEGSRSAPSCASGLGAWVCPFKHRFLDDLLDNNEAPIFFTHDLGLGQLVSWHEGEVRRFRPHELVLAHRELDVVDTVLASALAKEVKQLRRIRSGRKSSVFSLTRSFT
jgi:hypothetical protein